ncbi:alanine--tRNA ligase [Cellulosilyticum ruminicola]|uniref:alanine--tRNA ligase n=1 Tax=Cellulosilyticum ruminicola TaxID=425254 RepID=UPI0006D0D96C|nr:alanine--tRNA ligase [Cellulosilyticum ruminicola]
MKKYSLNELREMYLKFFESKMHLRAKSFPLVPHNDNSLLLINAGMAPLKPYFTGQEEPPRRRMTTCQKCIRTGDIENVGKTARHGTFFEMLGNFSFGDYFKDEAIKWAWEFVTKHLELPIERLYVSVYEADQETAEIWKNKIGVKEDHIVFLGKEDNFWEAGIDGPCGPCSEIYFDRGPEYGCDSPDCGVGCDCDRYMEFWNLVFTQFERHEDGTYTPLAQKNIDTGMGLERLAAMMQGVGSIFDVDTIKAIRDHVCELANATYGEEYKKDVSIRVITDHIRSVTFMAADGVLPSNEGRGYVMRRLLRRAVRHAKLLGIQGLFLQELVKTVVENSKHEYTELEDKFEYIVKLLTVEEKNFNETIDRGLNILKSHIEEMKTEGKTVLDGKACFTLSDTYGFPIDLTREILEEQGLSADEEEFKVEMDAQRQKARDARGGSKYMGADETVFNQMNPAMKTKFVGYHETSLEGTLEVLANDETLLDAAKADDEIYVVVSETPFYAESGGQAGDLGTITTATGKGIVTNTTKVIGGKFAHHVKVVEGTLEKGQKATFEVEKAIRMDVSRNHSATHLLQKALREVVGGHIEQAGSNVTKDRLRFDFTHFEALTYEQIEKVEALVNEKILEGLAIEVKEMPIDEARKLGAMALFGEKYGQTVRVVNMSGYSIEFCGGTHLQNTAAIGTFKIISETGVAAGVRRIEAVTGRGALHYYQEMENSLNEVAAAVKAKKADVVKRVEAVVSEVKSLEKENEKLKSEIAASKAESLLDQAEEVGAFKVLATKVDGLDMNALKNMGDSLKDQLVSGIVVLMSAAEDKVNLVVMATPDAVKAGLHCGKIISETAAVVDGKGGGRPNMAQAGGKNIQKIGEALEKAKAVIKEQVNA